MGWENVKTMLVVCVLLVACFSINMVNADSDDSAEHRALRDDSLADLLLKNLRFRDVEKRASNAEAVNIVEKLVKFQRENGGFHASRKRHSMSVTELAAMLNQLKGRGQASDDGVKLQSLRFGGFE